MLPIQFFGVAGVAGVAALVLIELFDKKKKGKVKYEQSTVKKSVADSSSRSGSKSYTGDKQDNRRDIAARNQLKILKKDIKLAVKELASLKQEKEKHDRDFKQIKSDDCRDSACNDISCEPDSTIKESGTAKGVNND